MIAGIIAAGAGSRLRTGGVATPKPLVRVAGVPIIERLLGALGRAGIRSVHCIVNEESTEVRDHVLSLGLTLPVSFVVRTTPTSMHSLFELAPALRRERFLLTTVDSIFDEGDLRGLVAAASADREIDGRLAVTSHVDDENPLYVEAGAGGRIVSFSRAGARPWVTGGLYALSPRIFDEMDAALGAGVGRLRHFLVHLVRAGYDLRIHPFSTIVDVDRPADILAAERFLGGR